MKKAVEEMSLPEREEILIQAADVLRFMYSYYDDFDYSCYFEGTEHLKKAAAFIDELILSEKVASTTSGESESVQLSFFPMQKSRPE